MSSRGPRPTAIGDYAIAAMTQALENDASRSALGDRRALKTGGVYRLRVPSAYNLRRAMRSESLQDALQRINREIAKHVYGLERWYIMDSTYFPTPYYEGCYPVDDGGISKVKKMKTAKLALVRGRDTGVVVACIVADENVNDQILFEPLFRMVLSRGGIVRGGGMLADAGFNKREHFGLVEAQGGRGFLDFDINAVASDKPEHAAYNRQLQFYKTNVEQWLLFFGYRSLIEQTNHSIKTVKRVLRARTPEARETEAQALIAGYNMGRFPELRLTSGMDLPFADQRAIDVIDALIQRRACLRDVGPVERHLETSSVTRNMEIPVAGGFPGSYL